MCGEARGFPIHRSSPAKAGAQLEMRPRPMVDGRNLMMDRGLRRGGAWGGIEEAEKFVMGAMLHHSLTLTGEGRCPA